MKKNQIFVGILMLVAIVMVAFTFAPGVAVLAFALPAGLLSSNSMKEQRSAFETELLGIINAAKTEKRDFTEAEISKRAELVSKINALDIDIELRKKEEAIEARIVGGMINEETRKQEDKELRKYSFLGAVRQISLNKQLTGIEKEMDEEGRKELRESGMEASGQIVIPTRIIQNAEGRKRAAEARTALLAGSSSGSYFVQTEVNDFIGALYDQNVVFGLGAKLIPGLVGNQSIPKSGGSSAAWEGETDANADGTMTATPVTASPKRLGAYGLISKTQILQAGNYDMEMLVRDDIIAAINEKLQVAVINGSGTGEPLGILNTVGTCAVAGGTNGAAPSQNHIVDLEKAVANLKGDVGAMAFLTNPSVRAKLKKTAIDAGSGQMVWDLKAYNELLGYKAGVTTAVPGTLSKGEGTDLSAIIFGNFSQCLVLQWGGFDIIVDPYTLAANNQLKITINSFWDVMIRQAAAFAAMKDAITA